MNKLMKFENKQFGEIRMVEIENKPYFIASDVAKSLGYKNSREAVKQHCRWVAKHDIPHPQSKNKTLQGLLGLMTILLAYALIIYYKKFNILGQIKRL